MNRILLFAIIFAGTNFINNKILAQTDRGNNTTYHRICGDFNWNGSKFFFVTLSDLRVDTKHKKFTGTGIAEGITNYYVDVDGSYKEDGQPYMRMFLQKVHPDPCDPIKLNGVDSFFLYSPGDFTVFFSSDGTEIKLEGTISSVSYCQGNTTPSIILSFSLSTHCHQKPQNVIDKKDSSAAKQEIITKITPNPVVNSSTISYTLTKTSKVNITVYNAMMQPVKVLVNETKNAGNYSVIWNANAAQIKPGIYRVVATVDGVVTSKMIQVIK